MINNQYPIINVQFKKPTEGIEENTEETEKKERIRRLVEIRVIRGLIVLFYFSDFSVRSQSDPACLPDGRRLCRTEVYSVV